MIRLHTAREGHIAKQVFNAGGNVYVASLIRMDAGIRTLPCFIELEKAELASLCAGLRRCQRLRIEDICLGGLPQDFLNVVNDFMCPEEIGSVVIEWIDKPGLAPRRWHRALNKLCFRSRGWRTHGRRVQRFLREEVIYPETTSLTISNQYQSLAEQLSSQTGTHFGCGSGGSAVDDNCRFLVGGVAVAAIGSG